MDHPELDGRSPVEAVKTDPGTRLRSRRSAILLVPSVVAAGRDTNVIVNPEHPDAGPIEVGPVTPVMLDRRHFGP